MTLTAVWWPLLQVSHLSFWTVYHVTSESHWATNITTQAPPKSFWKAGIGSMAYEVDPARSPHWDRCLSHPWVNDDRSETEMKHAASLLWGSVISARAKREEVRRRGIETVSLTCGNNLDFWQRERQAGDQSTESEKKEMFGDFSQLTLNPKADTQQELLSFMFKVIGTSFNLVLP